MKPAADRVSGPAKTGWSRYLADLHVHTCLSVCAEPEMTPAAIVDTARSRGLSMIAICDHDATGNCEPVSRISGQDLCVIAGIEITIEDEKHVLGLFGSPVEAAAAQAQVVGQPGNRSTLARAVAVIHEWRGLAIAAHVDRPASGILGRGGQISRGTGLDAFELSRNALGSQMHATLAALGFPLTTASDSHCLEDIGTCFSVLELPTASFSELKLAIRGEQGRRCSLA